MAESVPRRRTGRPSVERAAEIGRTIVAVTMAAFIEHGLAFSMDQIAATAGISKQSIYRRWPGKVDLLIHAIEELQERLVGELESDLPADPAAALREISWRLCRPDGGFRTRTAILLQTEALKNDALRSRLCRWSENSIVVLQRHLRAVTREVAGDAPDAALAQMLNTIIVGLGEHVFWYELGDDEAKSLFEDRWRLFRALVDSGRAS